MNPEFSELLRCFALTEVRYLIVGGYAVIHYSQPRETKDLDLWLEPTPVNAGRITAAFRQSRILQGIPGFLVLPDVRDGRTTVRGVPLEGIVDEDLVHPNREFFLGQSPCMFDFLTSVADLEFAPCWSRRNTVICEFGDVHYLGLEDLRITKRYSGRTEDFADLAALEPAKAATSQ